MDHPSKTYTCRGRLTIMLFRYGKQKQDMEIKARLPVAEVGR
jgi:hypothetical protein